MAKAQYLSGPVVMEGDRKIVVRAMDIQTASSQ